MSLLNVWEQILHNRDTLGSSDLLLAPIHHKRSIHYPLKGYPNLCVSVPSNTKGFPCLKGELTYEEAHELGQVVGSTLLFQDTLGGLFKVKADWGRSWLTHARWVGMWVFEWNGLACYAWGDVP